MRLRVKRLMILALVAIGAIACFTAPGWISKIDFDKSVVEEQYLDIGIEYKDGWYLIKDADDYYKMCETVNSGIGDGLKYRLENDITISAGVSMNVFSGTLDGNGHEVSVDTSLEPTYKPDVNSGVEASGFYGGFVGAIGLGYGYLSPSWTEDACARYELNSSYTISGTWGSSIQYVGVGGVCGVLLGGMYNMYIKYPSSLTLSIPQHDNTYYGYLVGVAWSGSIWNCGVDISAGTTIKDKDGNKIDFKAFSGAYAKGDSSVKQCLLITNDIGKDAEPITSSSADDGQAIPAGIAGGGGVVRYEGCYQWYYGRTRVDYNRDKEMFPDLRVATTIDEILAGRAWTIIEGVNNGYIYPTALADLSDIEVTVTFKNVEEETYNDGGKRCFFRTSNQNDNTTHKNTYKYNKELGGWASCGTPVRYGYYFSHFNTSWDGSGTSYYSTSKVKSNLTLYPIFNPITTTFKYDANGGEGTTSDSTVTYGEEYFTFSKNEFTREGYKFIGWAFSKFVDENDQLLEGEVKYLFGRYDYGFSASISGWKPIFPSTQTSTNQKTYDVILYAIWEKVPLVTIIMINRDGNEDTTDETNFYGYFTEGNDWTVKNKYTVTKTVESGEELGDFPNIYWNYGDLPRGYELKGIYTVDKNPTLQDKVYTNTVINADVTFYAHWQKIEYGYIGFGDSGDYILSSYTYNGGEWWRVNEAKLPQLLVPAGYTFSGIDTNGDGTANITVAQINAGYNVPESILPSAEGANNYRLPTYNEYYYIKIPATWVLITPITYNVEIYGKDKDTTSPKKEITLELGAEYALECTVLSRGYESSYTMTSDDANDIDDYSLVGWSKKTWSDITSTESNKFVDNNGARTAISYKYIYNNAKGSMTGASGDDHIVMPGQTISNLTIVEGDTISLYAHHTPKYTLTMYFNFDMDTLPTKIAEKSGVFDGYGGGDKCNEFNNGIQYKISYNISNKLNQEQYQIKYFNHIITGWKVEVDGIQYYVMNYSNGYIPRPVDVTANCRWKSGSGAVASGTPMQYLQGDIVATPIWNAPAMFEIRAHIESEGSVDGKTYQSMGGFKQDDPEVTTENFFSNGWWENGPYYAVKYISSGQAIGSFPIFEWLNPTYSNQPEIKNGYWIRYFGKNNSDTGGNYTGAEYFTTTQISFSAGGHIDIYLKIEKIEYEALGTDYFMHDYQTYNSNDPWRANEPAVPTLNVPVGYKFVGIDTDGDGIENLSAGDNISETLLPNTPQLKEFNSSPYTIVIDKNKVIITPITYYVDIYGNTDDVVYTKSLQYSGETHGFKVINQGTSKYNINKDNADLSGKINKANHVFVGWSWKSFNTMNAEGNVYDNATKALKYSYIYTHQSSEMKGEWQTNQTTGETEFVINSTLILDGIIENLSYTDNARIDLYAYWLPVYELEVKLNLGSNISQEVREQSGIYKDGIKQEGSGIVYTQDYYNGIALYTQEPSEAFNYAKQGNKYYNTERLHYYGHKIVGWGIEADETIYYVKKLPEGSEGTPTDSTPLPVGIEPAEEAVIYVWKDGEGTVTSGTLMQYLQGNIVATPIWEEVTFDVRFKTDSVEEYKNGYESKVDESGNTIYPKTTGGVKFGYPYYIYEGSIGTVTKSIEKDGKMEECIVKYIQATSISGYSVIYAHPYNYSNNIDEDIKITLTNGEFGNWEYILDYRTDDNGTTWYIEVEGYYAPNLYRVELDLQLPYGTDVVCNSQGFTKVVGTPSTVMYKHSTVVATGEHINAGYIDSQGNIYVSKDVKDGQANTYASDTKFYIYLLHDQIYGNKNINAKYTYGAIYNRYSNGKALTEQGVLDTEKILPTFEIDYYQMQYYYTFNNNERVNMYKVVGWTDDGENYYLDTAVNTLSQLEIDDTINNDTINVTSGGLFTDITDWKYGYAHIDENTGATYTLSCNAYKQSGDEYTAFALNVYWYRNIVNLEVENILDEGSTYVGYTLITETEQVTGNNLLNHDKYHLVIYDQDDNNRPTYLIYSFNDINDLTRYIDLRGKFAAKFLETETSGDVTRITSTTPTISIYFGNTFTVQAFDQSKDYSALDGFLNFIGYRFKEYAINAPTETNADGTIVEGRDSTNFTWSYDPDEYAFSVNLQNYEYGKEGVQYYFNDRDAIDIDAKFERIQYTFNYQVVDYQVVDDRYTLTPKYGTIRFDYGNEARDASSFAYTVTIDDYTALMSRMQVRVGTEHLRWELRNGVRGAFDVTVENSQSYSLILNASNLVEYIYNTGSNDYDFPVDDQEIYMYAICQDIEFNIKVEVKDVSTNSVIREYTLEGSIENPLFTASLSVSIENTYTLTMLTTDSGYIYYKQDEKLYVLRLLYINPTERYSTQNLLTGFEYPATKFDDISMSVTGDLLTETINYIQYTEVSEENRYLVFTVEVAPTYELTFEANELSTDFHKGYRVIKVGEDEVASASEGNSICATQTKYLGYWGQEVIMYFTADAKYYSDALLTTEYEDQDIVNEEIVVQANGNKVYNIKGDAVIYIQPTPKVYAFDMKVEFNGVMYETTEIDLITNASGIQIVTEITQRASSNTGEYVDGDYITVTYTLNSIVSNDYEATMTLNGEVVYPEEGKYVFTFDGKDMQVVLKVDPIPEAVIIKTNLPNHNIGNIYVQINEDTLQSLDQSQGTELVLVNGDKVNVYISERVGYEFEGSYTHNNATSQAELDQEGKFTLFDTTIGFDLTQKGYYYLNFKQTPISVKFEYNAVRPELEITSSKTEYTASSSDTIIQRGSEIHITKGEDNLGYRFDGYTYKAPKYEAGSVELEGTGNEGMYTFEVTEDIMEVLTLKDIEPKELELVVYVNYVRQYKYDYEYVCSPSQVETKVTSGTKELKEGIYYDYDTDIEITLKSRDDKHYMLKVELNTDTKSETINTTTVGEVEDVKDIQYTNTNNNVAGFTVSRTLSTNYLIKIDIEAEVYDTNLVQNLYHQVDVSEASEGQSLLDKGDEIFKLVDHIYYKVEGTHKYGSEVKVRIYVELPPEEYDDEQYYSIDNVRIELNGSRLSITEVVDSEVEGSRVYESKYLLKGDIPLEQELNIYFYALYHVDLKRG